MLYLATAKLRKMNIKIKIDELFSTEIANFLEEHISEMKAVSPPESKHALDLDGLRKSEVTFWTVWNNIDILPHGTVRDSPQPIISLREGSVLS